MLDTLEKAKAFLDYHAPDEEAKKKHETINQAFQELVEKVWDVLPAGPGRTVAIRAMGVARMQCNSCIANEKVEST